MLLGQVFERFIKESPVSVMVRGLLEKALCPQILDELFERSAKTQYTRELLFSTVVNLMSLVVCGVHPSVHAAHQASIEEIGVSEQNIILSADDGQLLKARRVKVCLKQPNRDGDREIFILTNLPSDVANAMLIARMYRKRWKLETLFQVLTENLCCEINTLGYPKAALFTFCIALVAYNVLSTVQAALRSVHGTEKIEAEISSYYLADEIKGTYRGMMIAIPPEEWHIFQNITFIELSQILKHLAGKVQLRAFRRHPRGLKKPLPKRTYLKNRPHVSTAKILNQKKLENNTP